MIALGACFLEDQHMSLPDTHQPFLIRACRGQTLARPPVWLMRQAGRYMSEYQAMRQKYSFLTLCKNVDAAVEVSLQPYKAFGMDAVIMFSDILVIPEAMGLEVVFTESHGPQLPRPVRTEADIDALSAPDPHDKIPFVMQILKQLRRELAGDPDTALIGFSGSPWTLATYMIEGGGSKHHIHIKTLMAENPRALHRLLEMLSRAVALYLNAQIESGAQVVQLFDTWAGQLSRDQYRRFVLPYHRQVIDSLHRDQTPVILYVNNSAHLLDLMAEANPDVISVDHLTALSDARAKISPGIALQGNLDPALLFAKPDTLQASIESMLAEGGRSGYIANLGHGILPQTPVENVRLFVDTVKKSALKNSEMTGVAGEA